MAQFAIEHDLFLITDEIYEYFVYDGARHICPATLPGMRERTIVISGFSKTFSITGWRIGYATADARWMPAMAHFHDLTYVCAPAPLQVGAAAGLEQLPPSFYTQLAADHKSKRGRLLSCARRCGHGALSASGRLLHHGQSRAPARAKRPPRKRGTCCARPAWPPLPDRRSSAPGAARICCASASPSRMRSSTRPASGCGSCKRAAAIL